MIYLSLPVLTLVHRHFIAQARLRRPVVPAGVSEYIVQSYVRLRKEHKEQEEENKTHSYTSARTLLAVLRLSQALARLRFAETVDTADVDEALRLMEASKESLAAHEAVSGGRRAPNAASRIYNLVKSLADSGACRADADDGDEEDDEAGGAVELAMRKVRERVLAKGFTEDQWLNALDEYTSLDVSNLFPPPQMFIIIISMTLYSGKLVLTKA